MQYLRREIDLQKRERSTKHNLPTSINDIRDKYFVGESLEKNEKLALSRFDNYRIWYLNSANGELEFHKRYEELQARANLSPFEEFLQDKYDLPQP